MNPYNMIPLGGLLLVFAAVVGGFLLEKGDLRLLVQPAEFVIICGAATGTMLLANPPRVLAALWRKMRGVMEKQRFSREEYRETLGTLYTLFMYARKNAGATLEDALDHPRGSAAFQGHSAIVRDEEVQDFVCDTLRTAVSGIVPARDLDRLLERDIEVREQELAVPANSLSTLGETLPGLGIVAAVLGILVTMASMGGPPKVVGEKVATALVGTFLGIFISYGFVTPMAEHIKLLNDAEEQYYSALRSALVAHARGVTPRLSVEFARRIIPESVRPAFAEMEQILRPRVRVITENREGPH